MDKWQRDDINKHLIWRIYDSISLKDYKQMHWPQGYSLSN